MFADGSTRARVASFHRSTLRAHAEQFARERYDQQMRRSSRTLAAPHGRTMVRRYNRLLVAFHVVLRRGPGDVGIHPRLYAIRFEGGLIPYFRGHPPFSSTNLLPFVAVLTPLAFQVQGVYRLRRGRSRVDDFFAVFVGSILAVVVGVVTTLHAGLLASDDASARGAYEVSQSPGCCSSCSPSVHVRVAGVRSRAASSGAGERASA